MIPKSRNSTGWALSVGALAVATLFTGCGRSVPQEAIEAVESVDRDLMRLRAAEIAPDDYGAFANQWATLRARIDAEADLIHWPWESNDVELSLRRLQAEGAQTVARLADQQETLRLAAERQITSVQRRAKLMTRHVHAIEGRLVLGSKPVETDLLLKQARTFYDNAHYKKSLEVSERASKNLSTQTALLSRELGRYADRDRINRWKRLADDTIAWSNTHHSTAIVVSKADRTLTLYKNGRKVLSYPVRLGFNGIKEKRYQGDGATPEGRYRITSKRGKGQTQFYRALVLNYPNEEDRRRFVAGKKAGNVPALRGIGGQIEIHGAENELMAQTLGCVMLENPHIAFLFDRVDQGTPVTIVGALHEENTVALALAELAGRNDET